jgi:hypothetical protein
LRYGYFRIYILVRREGWRINHKRVYRLYRQDGLRMQLKRPRRHVMAAHRIVSRGSREISDRGVLIGIFFLTSLETLLRQR